MNGRKPLKLNSLIVAYNVFQILSNFVNATIVSVQTEVKY